jgi:type II secretory pathway component GspD/PulD (secretin)
LFEAGGGHHKATWFGPGNAVMLRSTAAELDQMEAIIAQLDVPSAEGKPAEPRLDTTVIHVQHAVAKELASVLLDLAGHRGSRRRGSSTPRVVVEERLNSLVLKGSPDQVTDLKILIEQLDVPAGPLPPGDL